MVARPRARGRGYPAVAPACRALAACARPAAGPARAGRRLHGALLHPAAALHPGRLGHRYDAAAGRRPHGALLHPAPAPHPGHFGGHRARAGRRLPGPLLRPGPAPHPGRLGHWYHAAAGRRLPGPLPPWRSHPTAPPTGTTPLLAAVLRPAPSLSPRASSRPPRRPVPRPCWPPSLRPAPSLSPAPHPDRPADRYHAPAGRRLSGPLLRASRLIPAASATGSTPPLAVVRTARVFALARHLIPTGSATGSTLPPTFARTARSFTRLPRLIPATSAVTTPALAAVRQARLRPGPAPIPAASATGSTPPAAAVSRPLLRPVAPHPDRLGHRFHAAAGGRPHGPRLRPRPAPDPDRFRHRFRAPGHAGRPELPPGHGV